MQDTDVVAFGELLIDFIQSGESHQGNSLFEANPGGAPCNVLAMLAGLGRKTQFIGKVGRDMFGKQLKKALEEVGIGTHGLREDEKVPTTLALVHKLDNGDRDFSFYRSPGADMMMTPDEVDEGMIETAKIFHFGSLSMTDEPARSATKKALCAAERAGVIRSFDPNLRPPLWKSLKEAKEQIGYGLAHCDFLKISDNEIQWLTGKSDYTDGIDELKKHYDMKLICLSMGKDGSRVYFGGSMVEAPAMIQENTIETTGAGDTFCACILHHILEYGLDNPDAERLREALWFANAAASVITTRKGALKVMPKEAEVRELLKRAGAADVDNRSYQHGPHSITGNAVCADNGGQRILYKSKWNHCIDDEAVITC